MASKDSCQGIQIRDAGAPFDDPKGDIILRTSDSVDFRIFRLMLSLASPVFEDMFRLPPTKSPDHGDEMKEGTPVISISEESNMLDILLSLYHPMCSSKLQNIEDIGPVLAMAIKYDMTGLEKRIREQSSLMLHQYMILEPLRAYAVACRFKMAEEIEAAARETLRIALPDLLDAWPVTEFEFITAAHVQNLYHFHRRCSKTLTAEEDNIASSFILRWFRTHAMTATTATTLCPHCNMNSSKPNPKLQEQEWLACYIRDSCTALSTRPHNSTVSVPKLTNRMIERLMGLDQCTSGFICSKRRLVDIETLTRFIEDYADWVKTVTNKVCKTFLTSA